MIYTRVIETPYGSMYDATKNKIIKSVKAFIIYFFFNTTIYMVYT